MNSKESLIAQVESFKSLEELAEQEYHEISSKLDDPDLRAVFIGLQTAEAGHAAVCARIIEILRK